MSDSLKQALAEAFAPRIDDPEAMRFAEGLAADANEGAIGLTQVPIDICYTAMLKFAARTPAPASADAMDVWKAAERAEEKAHDQCIANAILDDARFFAAGDQAAARIIQQALDQREAAGFRRGVEAAAKVAKDRARRANRAADLAPEHQEEFWAEHGASEGIARRILAFLETQEAG